MELVKGDLAQRLVRNANKRLLALWTSSRQERRTPVFADLNLNVVDAWRENLGLYEHRAPHGWTCLFYGRELARHTRIDMTGRVLDDFEPRHAEPLRRAFETAVETGEPVLLVHTVPKSPVVHTWERLVLPVEGPSGPVLLSHALPLVLRKDLIESILQSGPAALLACAPVLGPDGDMQDLSVLVCNAAAVDLFGIAENDQIGMPLSRVIDLHGSDVMDFCRLVLKSGVPTRLEAQWRIGDRDSFFEISITRFDGGLTLTIADLGELRRAYKDLELQKAEALAANRQLGEQAASLARLNEAMSRAREALDEEIAQRSALEAELRRLAATDDLTGVMNRRAFLEELRREVARSERHGNPIALLALDIDRFKQINDHFGHAAGDDVLQIVAGTIARTVRCGLDQVGRTGGEEFCVLLPETDLEGARLCAERLRDAIATLRLDPIGRSVTASFGVALWNAPDETLEGWLARADRALYRAKDLGRDRVELADRPERTDRAA